MLLPLHNNNNTTTTMLLPAEETKKRGQGDRHVSLRQPFITLVIIATISLSLSIKFIRWDGKFDPRTFIDSMGGLRARPPRIAIVVAAVVAAAAAAAAADQ
eukprot:GHVU01186611.1.p3 GENE.GHVU01186611.1~~GHVU01186611.1.p3  ORF type:complete len:101 (+),score=23.15 GHVU01186611.1:635-937(+)